MTREGMRSRRVGVAALAVVGILLQVGCGGSEAAPAPGEGGSEAAAATTGTAAASALHGSADGAVPMAPNGAEPGDLAALAAAAGEVVVYKSPTCGCCAFWVDHMEEHGFTVRTQDLQDLRPIKARYGIPAALGSCHTAVVDGYAIEGHVPAQDILRLLAERPDVEGLAVPGMPVGSPGMEMEGYAPDPYDVVAFSDGRTTVFQSHR